MRERILVVDDNRLNVRLLKDILEEEGFEVHSAKDGLLVNDLVYKIKPDVILLDIMMPGIDGFEVCKLIKSEFEIKDIPIIMITSKTDSSDVKKALELGAFDYIKKPIDEVEVVARVQSALRFKLHQDKLKDMAMKDSLTGLYNHALLFELFDKEFNKQERISGNISFIMIDIDFFKNINDKYGHLSGDMVLKELSDILLQTVRDSDIVGRYGGEEFGIVVSEVDRDEVSKMCERVRKYIEENKFQTNSHEHVDITVSIGFCYKESKDKIKCSEMIKFADIALYEAKENGRNNVKAFHNE